jgi:hypothetical protein
VAKVGKAGTRNETDIAGTNNLNTHNLSSPFDPARTTHPNIGTLSIWILAAAYHVLPADE